MSVGGSSVSVASVGGLQQGGVTPVGCFLDPKTGGRTREHALVRLGLDKGEWNQRTVNRLVPLQ